MTNSAHGISTAGDFTWDATLCIYFLQTKDRIYGPTNHS